MAGLLGRRRAGGETSSEGDSSSSAASSSSSASSSQSSDYDSDDDGQSHSSSGSASASEESDLDGADESPRRDGRSNSGQGWRRDSASRRRSASQTRAGGLWLANRPGLGVTAEVLLVLPSLPPGAGGDLLLDTPGLALAYSLRAASVPALPRCLAHNAGAAAAAGEDLRARAWRALQCSSALLTRSDAVGAAPAEAQSDERPRVRIVNACGKPEPCNATLRQVGASQHDVRAAADHWELWASHPLGARFVRRLLGQLQQAGDVQTLSTAAALLDSVSTAAALAGRPVTATAAASASDAASSEPPIGSLLRTALSPAEQPTMASVRAARDLYTDQLYRAGLWIERADVLKSFHSCETEVRAMHPPGDEASALAAPCGSGSGSGTEGGLELRLLCAGCGAPSKDCTRSDPRCQDRTGKGTGAVTLRCGVCDLPVRSLATLCPFCGHGGHRDHYWQWFNGEGQTECPTGCGCQCADVSVMFSEDAQAAMLSLSSAKHGPATSQQPPLPVSEKPSLSADEAFDVTVPQPRSARSANSEIGGRRAPANLQAGLLDNGLLDADLYEGDDTTFSLLPSAAQASEGRHFASNTAVSAAASSSAPMGRVGRGPVAPSLRRSLLAGMPSLLSRGQAGAGAASARGEGLQDGADGAGYLMAASASMPGLSHSVSSPGLAGFADMSDDDDGVAGGGVSTLQLQASGQRVAAREGSTPQGIYDLTRSASPDYPYVGDEAEEAFFLMSFQQ
jgi:hypothetical protein